MIRIPLASILLCTLLAGCGSDADEVPPVSESMGATEPLPAPEPSVGSVTGMPDGPGPGDVPLGGQPAQGEAVAIGPDGQPLDPDATRGLALVLPVPGPQQGEGLPPLEEEPEAGLVADDPPQIIVGGVATADAVAVVREYYAAIASGDHARAYALWSGGGRSSGQTAQQFAAGFADTRSVSVQPGEPGVVEGGAGSRHVEVPVSVTTIHADGREQRYVGAYVLREGTAAGGAGPRSWRIASAQLREYQPQP